MVKAKTSVEKVKEFWNSEVMDEERWAQNSNLKAPVLECLKPFFQSDEYSKASGSFLQFDEYVRIVHSTILEIWRFLEDPSWVYLCNVLEYSKMLRALGLFAASILLMRNYGDLMAI